MKCRWGVGLVEMGTMWNLGGFNGFASKIKMDMWIEQLCVYQHLEMVFCL
ncbi:MAG TPA: hypothetical protein GX692_06295 [Acholeplasmataceae bacterium]|nr:hypothetical protein [Acholeplasmataceae bacterium]